MNCLLKLICFGLLLTSPELILSQNLEVEGLIKAYGATFKAITIPILSSSNGEIIMRPSLLGANTIDIKNDDANLGARIGYNSNGLMSYGGFLELSNEDGKEPLILNIDENGYGSMGIGNALGEIKSLVTPSNIKLYDLNSSTRLIGLNAVGGFGQVLAYGPNGNKNVVIGAQPDNVANGCPDKDRGRLLIYDEDGNVHGGFKWFDSGLTSPCADALEVFADAKHFRMDHPNDSTKDIVYTSLEGAEAGAYERGTATLVNGKAFVPYSDHFAIVINEKTVTAILTPHTIETFGLAVTKKDEFGIYVEELQGNTGNFNFDYEIKGVRAGYENMEVIRDKIFD